ncbi:MAG: PIN domain-containing protein [Bryobacteraceae bacterium]|nr:PIN domain-containing protein [Bryobacteraceae bacterium]
MSGREFVDTNILVYAFDRTAVAKREAAIELLERLWLEHTGCVSLQVLQEFYVATTRKLSMPPDHAKAQVERLGKWRVHRPALEDVLASIESHRRKRISFWDALILRSASQLGCSVLWSEDLKDGVAWDAVIVRNPFLK